jgi:hypothetical protein
MLPRREASVSTAWTTGHRATVIVAAAALALLLASCATYDVSDDLPADAEKGWVVFVADEDLPLSVSRLAGTTAGVALPDRNPRSRPVAIACPPGRNDFMIRDPGGETRVIVPVVEGMVTHVGILRQVASEVPPATWYPRVSVGTHPLPLDPRTAGPAPFVTALVDRDWATRWAAARGLARVAPPLEPTAAPLLTAMAREDAQARVRAAARSTLAAAGRPVPAEPLVVVSFEQDVVGWPLGEGLASSASLAAEGYRLEGTDPAGTAWRIGSPDPAIRSTQDLDLLLECRWLGGSGSAGYGLALASGPGTFLAFCVSREGGAIVTRIVDGRRVATPLPWTASAAPAISGTTIARIGVEKRGVRYAVTINGEPVGGFVDSSSLAVDRVGVFVDGAQSVVFRKIVVAAP